MAEVCRWFGLRFCCGAKTHNKNVLIKSQRHNRLHPEIQVFDAVVVWRECPKETSHAVAYDLIYKPPAGKSPMPASPQCDRSLSREDIDQKLKDAAERRETMEREREEKIVKDRQRREEAAEKVAKEEEELKRRTAEKLAQKMEEVERNRDNYYKDVQDRLSEHIKRVMDVRQKNDQYVEELRQRVEQNLEKKNENREALLQSIKEKLQEHDVHVEEVKKMVNARSKEDTEKSLEGMMDKMENAMKNKEKQINDLLQKLSEHDKHAEEVRQNKSAGGDIETVSS